MSHNVSLSFQFFYAEDLLRNMDDADLYHHVKETTMRLGIPTPARANVKKIGDGTVFIERVSCHPYTLRGIERAIETAGSLKNTSFGLIAISSPELLNLNRGFPVQSMNQRASSPATHHPSNMTSQAFAKDTSPSEAGTLLSRVSSSRLLEENLPPNDPHWVDRPWDSIPDARSQSPSSPHKKESDASLLHQLHPPVTFPPKPSWSTDHPANSRLSRGHPRAEPNSPAIVPSSLGDRSSPRPPETSIREHGTSGITLGPLKSRISSPKREREVDEDGDNSEYTGYKRRRLEGDPSQSEERSQRDVPISRMNGSKASASSMGLDDGREESHQLDLQRLQMKISDLESTLRTLRREQDEVNSMRQELAEEKSKRIRAELIVEDIKREMKDPFIVPSLLSAFIAMADISNACTEDLP